MVVQELVTMLGFQIDDKALDELGKKMENAKTLALGLGAAVIGAGAALIAITKTAANSAGEIVRLSNATGVGTAELQRLGYAAKLSGSSMDELGGGLKILSKNIVEAARNPMGEGAKAFRNLGIRAFDASGKARSASDVFLDLSESFQKVTNPTERAAISMQLLGRAGGGLVELLAKGPKRISELTAEFEAMGGALSQEQLETLTRFNDSVDRTFSLLGKLRNVIALKLAPVLTDLLDGFRKFIIENQKIIKYGMEKVFGGLVIAIKLLARSFEIAGKFFGILVDGLGGAKGAMNALLIIAGALAALIGGVLIGSVILLGKLLFGMAAGFLTAIAPVIPIVIALSAVLALVFLWLEDIYTFLTGGNSITGALIEAIGDGIDSAIDYMKKKFTEFKDWLIPIMYSTFTKLGEIIVAVVTGPLKLLISGIEWVFTKLGLIRERSPGLGMVGNGSITGVTPRTAPSTSGNTSSNMNINAPVSVIVPPGTDPSSVGDVVREGVGDGFGQVLREMERFTSPGVAY